jgi:FAD/FMN-containing dehydrogenase
MMQRYAEKIRHIEVRGLEHLRAAIDAGLGVLITPNHSTYADPYLLLDASDRVGRPFYFMTAWQVFGTAGSIKRMVLQRHGCFSVDRDGADLRAFREAVHILQHRPHPLVVFPEGEIYHVSDQVMPFHDGPAAIAHAAAKGGRGVVCVPCALKYHYLEDPTPRLERLLDDLERAFFWRPRPDLSLEKRLFQLAEGALALKELEYLGQTCAGGLSERIGKLCETVLGRLETRYAIEAPGKPMPVRVKALRRLALERLAQSGDELKRRQAQQDLDNLFFVVQLFSYPQDYVAKRPSIERIADTLDKLEEDILGVPLATVRGARGAIIAFGPPITVSTGTSRGAAATLTRTLEERVQGLLDTIDVPELPGHAADRCPFEVNDVQSRLNATRVAELVRPTSLDEIQGALAAACQRGLPVSVCGGRHAMGGQQFGSGTMLLDLRGCGRILSLDRERGLIEVEGGIEWPELIEYLHSTQAGEPRVWSIRQKQTGVDRVTLAGSLSANGHGRGLRFPPLASDVESFVLVDAAGKALTCSRRENTELFALALGGYGLFGVIARVTLRLVPRQKVRRVVKIIPVAELLAQVAGRIEEGFTYGDCQYSTDLGMDAEAHPAVFSCYQPVADDTPIPVEQKHLSEEDWAKLYGLARANKRKAFETYAGYYLSTSGQVYWSDTHQMSGGIDYYHHVLEQQRGLAPNSSEMITEVYVRRADLLDFLRAAREDFREHKVDLTYGTIRFIEKDEDTFLAWAKPETVCVLCNLNVVHTDEGKRKAADDFRRLIGRAVSFGGRYFMTYHRWATRDQVLAAYPQLPEFLRLKKKYDPAERFQSEWYRWYREILG